MSPKESLNCEFISKILHLLPPFYPIFTCGSGSEFGIWIRIQEAPEYGSGSTTLYKTSSTYRTVRVIFIFGPIFYFSERT